MTIAQFPRLATLLQHNVDSVAFTGTATIIDEFISASTLARINFFLSVSIIAAYAFLRYTVHIIIGF
jgi:hypothetical protein